MRSNVIQGYFPNGLPRFDHAAAAQPKMHAPHVKGVPAVQLPPQYANRLGGGGQPLPPAVRQKMEAAFRTSFADVRMHVGPEASSIRALAFTHGTNVYFAPGQYNEKLLAHELAHVVQQRAGRVRNPFGSGIAIVQDAALEAEAERAGLRALVPQPVQRKVAPIQRQVVRGADTEVRSIDLTTTILEYTDFGRTPVTLNGETFPGGDPTRAVNAPTFQDRITSGGTHAVTIIAEPTNTVSSQVLLPTAPPWTALSVLDVLAGRISGTGDGYEISDAFIGRRGRDFATLRVKGRPDDATFAGYVRQHELVHVADIDRVIDAVLRPWDQRIHDEMVAGTEYHGATQAAAEAACYADVGGTPAEIGTRFRDRLRDLALAYHRTGPGSAPRIDGVTSEKLSGGIRITVHYRHPAG